MQPNHEVRSFIFLGLAISIIIGFFSSCDEKNKQGSRSSPTIQPTEKAQNIRPPTKSWEKVIPHQEVPEGIGALDSKHCGACHQAHYEEWKYSTHSHAWTDLQFQAELKKDSSPIFCINCHIPLQNQQEWIVKGFLDGDIYKPVKEKNPRFDRDLQQEGINCASCHVRNNVIVGPTGTDKAPHKTVKDTEHLSEKLCISCHNAVATITPTLPCTFETGDEWKAGPFYKTENCITCHMPETEREIVAGYGKRKSRFHFFKGSGIPKRKGAKTKIFNGFNFYPTKLKTRYNKNEKVSFSITLKNEYAGHNVPTGDPERFFIILLELKDAKGKVIATEKGRIGEVWEWYPKAKKLSDNNVPPGEKRTYSITQKLPKKGKYSLSVKITKHRISDEAADYNKLGDAYPRFITVFNQSYDFTRK